MKVKRLVAKTSLLLPPPGSSILAQTTLCHPAACKTILGRGDLLSLLSSLLPLAPPYWYKPPFVIPLLAEVEFVNAVTAGGSVKFLSAV